MSACEHCLHWTRRQWRDLPDPGAERDPPEIGVCRGGPPALSPEPTNVRPADRDGPGPWDLRVHLGVWPHTRETDYCGAFCPSVAPPPDPAPAGLVD